MTFGILGPLDVRDTADRPLTIRRRKARTLLALLLCHRDQNVSADLLTEWLWDAKPPASALANLHSYVSDLRRVLAGTRAAGGLHTTDQGYLLQVGPGQLDSDRFADLAATGAQALADGDAPGAVEHLGRAAGLWRGEVLAGVIADRTLPPAMQAQLAELTQRRLEVFTGHAQARLMVGRYHEVAVELTTLTARFPRYEPLWRQLMLAYAYAGRPDEADRAYDRLTTNMALDADADALTNADRVEPSAETAALRDRIRRADLPEIRVRRQSALRPAVLGPSTHGSSAHRSTAHRLITQRLAARGSSIHEVAVRGLARWASPRHLPAPPDHFVGRLVECAALDRAAGIAQLVTIVGGPGVGKTGLALTWAHRVADRYPDGQLHVELHGHTTDAPADPRELLCRMLRAVGATEPATDTLSEVAAALRTALAGRRMLILLDDAVNEAQIRPLLPGTGSCLTVVTSRNRLDGLVAHEGATRLRLGELSPAEAHELLLDMREPRSGTADTASIGSVSLLAERCGYLPLALRIVAAGGHEGNPLTASDGERSVRAAFDASWSRLDELDRQVLRALGQMPDRQFTAAEATDGLATAGRMAVDCSQVAEALGRLDRVSLIERLGSDLYQLSPMTHRYAARMTVPGSAIFRYRDWLARLSELSLCGGVLDDSTAAYG